MSKVMVKGKEVELTLDESEVFDYLVNLRDSGVTNMWGAAAYIQGVYKCSKEEATYWLVHWIESFQKGD